MLKLYQSAAKAVHGALIAAVPVVLACEAAGASLKVEILSALGAILGVGSGVYVSSNKPLA